MQTHIKYEPLCGEDISTACRCAWTLHQKTGLPVHFVFNGVNLTATGRHWRYLVYDFYADSTKHEAESLKKKCPHCGHAL